MVQAQSNDMVAGQEPIVVPENIQSLLQQIKIAEDNENWEEYSKLREEIIQAWREVNPEVAKLYRNVNDGTPDLTADGRPATNPRRNFSEPTESILYETPMESQFLWGDDVLITGGKAYDFSMDISRDDEIYVAVLGRLDVSSTEKDSVYIYKSTNGGSSWVYWSSIYIFSATPRFQKIELMCFDGQIGGSGDSYLLLFYLFDDGFFRVGRTSTSTPSWSYYTISGSLGNGFTTDFAVDRNNSATNYRAICVYDSTNWIKSIRSEPTSYGTVWQDAAFVGSATVGKDVDFCYGWNGDVYATFNGFNTGNLYAIENTNYADPTSWGSLVTLVTGNTDTTRRAEIISTREDDPSNTAFVLFERQNGSTFDIYSCTKASGGSTWGTMAGWVTTLEDKWPALYSRKTTGNQVVPGVFEQSENGNAVPRTIRYKAYSGTGWSTSVQVSDDGIDVTGLQKPEAGELAGNVPVFAYGGANYIGVYFDNFSWTPTSVEDELTPVAFSLEQNYPNPFNPATMIKFSIPEASTVSLKIYDVLGNEIASLLNEEKNKGTYEVNFTATNLSSGIYFYKLEAGNFVQTKKMILMK
jgi:hypothetical protein